MASCCRTTCSCVINAGNRVTITGNGSATSPYVINADQTVVTVTDTPTVDMTLTGSGTAASPYNISSAVKLDSTPPGGGTNLIQSNAEGLYLECAQVRTCISAGPGATYDPATGVVGAKISGTAGNTTSISGDGGIYTPASGQVTVADTPTVDMTLTGAGTTASPYIVSSAVKLEASPPGGGSNLIKQDANGLYLECAQVRTCISAGPGATYDPATGVVGAKISGTAGNTTSISGDGGIYTPASGQVAVADTPTVDMTLTGAGTTASPYIVSSAVKLEASPPGGGSNLIKQDANGLYLECAQVRTCFSAGDGAAYDPATGVITARLSTDAGNTTVFGSDGGLYSSGGGGGGDTFVQALDTPTVDTTVTGAGTAGSPYLVSGAVKLEPAPPGGGSNLIKSDANGLYVECAQVRTCFSAGPGATYDPATGVIGAKISTDAGNSTVLGSDGGLYSPPGGGTATVLQVGDTNTVDNTLTGAGTAASPYVITSAVKLEAAPPGGGSNLIKSDANGLYLECAQVRTCISAGDGAAYDPATGVITARLSTDAGNTTVFGTDGGIMTPSAAALVTGCGLDGAGTAADPLVVVPEAGQAAWSGSWACNAATFSTLKCDPGTGKLWTPPDHYSAMDHIYVEHFSGGIATPIGPTGGWVIINNTANQQFNIPANFLGNQCRTWGYEIMNSGTWDIEHNAAAAFQLGLVVQVNGGTAQARPLWGHITAVGAAHRERGSGVVAWTGWNIPAGTGASVIMWPAVNVTAGQITAIHSWISDATIDTQTSTP
jgi:hypothetical protein